MQDWDIVRIVNRVKHLFNMHFEDDRIICKQPGSQGHLILIFVTSACKLYLKNTVFCGLLANLAELKTRTLQHIFKFIVCTLRSVVENAVCRF